MTIGRGNILSDDNDIESCVYSHLAFRLGNAAITAHSGDIIDIIIHRVPNA